MKGLEVEGKGHENKISRKSLRNWLMLMQPIYGTLLKIVCYKLVMKYVEKRKIEETMGIHGGGMKR